MANIKELRGRIRSVASIAKITKAMEMVASMKLRKVQAKALSLEAYTRELRAIGAHLGEALPDFEHPLFTTRPVTTTGLFVVTSDRGLCGAYNANVFAELRATIAALREADPERRFKFYVFGRKGLAYLRKRGFDVARYYQEPGLEKAGFAEARIAAEEMLDDFTRGTVDEVRLVWTEFVSAARFAPRTTPFIPLGSGAVAGAGTEKPSGPRPDYLLEPDPRTLMERLLPRYLETVVYFAMLSSLASEMASRRMAMKGATDAASRMGRQLRKRYNRARQESITKELLDIIGGANAVA